MTCAPILACRETMQRSISRESTLAQQRQILSLAKPRLAGGIGTQLKVSQVETPLREYERGIDTIEESIALAKNQLAALPGECPGAGVSITRPTLALATPAGLPSALPADLVGHRPDIVAARWTVAAQARGIEVAKADFYPNINLLASIGGYATMIPLSQFLKSQSGSWTGSPAMSLPIFVGGRLRAQQGAASAGYDEAVKRYNQKIIAALKDVSHDVVRTRSLQNQRDDAQRSVAIAHKTYDLASESCRRGLTDYVNVLVSQTQFLHEKQRLAKVQAEQLLVHASLVTALGGGLDDPKNSPADGTLSPAQHAGPLAQLHSIERSGSS
jgi:NodT family efflux transporter outer membrane factor (OMF) lipoprotein